MTGVQRFFWNQKLARSAQHAGVPMLPGRAVAAGCLAVALLLCVAFDGSEAASKKKSKSRKKAVQATDPLKCGVCEAVVEVLREEVRKKENDTSTLDLRWGLTAEVKEGKARRLGKVIPYKRSELLATELMEKVCNSMTDYGTYRGVEGETQMIQMAALSALERELGQEVQHERVQKDRKAAERHCEELVDSFAEKITGSIRDGLNHTDFVDALCYGDGDAFCGARRRECGPGSYGQHLGLAPCTLCPKGFWQTEFKASQCIACKPGFNTSAVGSKAGLRCMPVCAPGSFSSNGLDMQADEGPACSPCAIGQYEDKPQSTSCAACGQGKTTLQPGAATRDLCVDKCGDGMKSATEGCDDGNTADGDGCGSTCVVERGALCAHAAGFGRSECRLVVCGDGKMDAADDGSVVETCDDGNSDGGDGCSASCQVEEKAVCADTARGATSRCNAVQCGDGRVQASNDGLVVEECDDGNEADGDGCSSSCAVDSGFLCRNPKSADKTADRGPTACRNVKCGDGFVDGSNDGSRIEECDDGNEADGDGCSAACVLEDGYICTTQNQEHGSEGLASERSSCTAVVCGDGYRESSGQVSPVTEECDDGNVADNDGCSSSCRVEAGFECSEYGSRRSNSPRGPLGFSSGGRDVCKRKEVCGDGLRVGAEECDDANSADGDGCSGACKVEDGWKCAAPRLSADAPMPAPGAPLPDECSRQSGGTSGPNKATDRGNAEL